MRLALVTLIAVLLHGVVLWALPERAAPVLEREWLVRLDAPVLAPAPEHPRVELAAPVASAPRSVRLLPRSIRRAVPAASLKVEPSVEPGEGLSVSVATRENEANTLTAEVGSPAVVDNARATEGAGGGERGWGSYHSELSAKVNSGRRYPREARRLGISGVTLVEFCVGRDGQLTCRPTVMRSSHPILDAASMQLIEVSAPFAAFPAHRPESELRFVVDVRFELN